MQANAFIRSLISLAAAPYRAAGRSSWLFARGKLGGDPVFVHLLSTGLLSSRQGILDIGCGQGLLASWLLAARSCAAGGQWPAAWPLPPAAFRVHGVELMARDVERAQKALAKAVLAGDVTFLHADMCRIKLDPSDAIVILDVLHYVSFAEQAELLQRIRDALVPGGVLLLRVGDAAAGLPFTLSNWVDQVVTTLRTRRLGRLCCRTLADWTTLLEDLGFTVEPRSMSEGTPFANVLLVAHRP